MKWIATALFLIIFLHSVNSECDDDLWSFDNLTVLAFSQKGTRVLPTEDGLGVRLEFSDWNPEMETELTDGLKNTDVEYLLFPTRQAAMTVELFSRTGAISSSYKKHKNTLQIIIGKSRSELPAINVLLDPKSQLPLKQEAKDALKDGYLGKARQAMYGTSMEKKREQFLLKSRLAVINAGLRGGRATDCEPLPLKFNHPEWQEGTLLLAWCHFSRDDTNKAVEALNQMEASNPSKELVTRIKEQRRKFIVTDILNNERLGNSIGVANTFYLHGDEVIGGDYSINLLETIADSLNQNGLGILLTNYADNIVARTSDAKLRKSIPAIAEAYLNAGQIVRASDAASFFLVKRLPNWVRGRLLKVRGHVALQEGNWKQAIADITKGVNLLGTWTQLDQLAVTEAYLRSNIVPTDELFSSETQPSQKELIPVLKKAISQWNLRLQNQIKLIHGIIPREEDLKELPDHILYNALSTARSNGKTQMALEINSILEEKKGGWADLARLDKEIEQLQSKLTKLTPAKDSAAKTTSEEKQ